MTKTKIILLGFLLFHLTSYSQAIDTSACKIIEKKLDLIKKYVDGGGISLEECRKAIVFFTELTGIPSNSRGNYIGQYQPTNSDYISWRSWYILNKDFIYWSKKTNEIVLNKKVQVQ